MAILCIDEPYLLATRRLVLEKNGHEVQAVHTVAEALETLRRGSVDCVLASHDPPFMDGIRVVEQIRQLHPKIPIVVVTPFPSAVRSLAVECLSGLEGPEALLAAVQRALDKKLPARSNGEGTRQQEHKSLHDSVHENLRTSLELSAEFKELQEKTIAVIRQIRGRDEQPR